MPIAALIVGLLASLSNDNNPDDAELQRRNNSVASLFSAFGGAGGFRSAKSGGNPNLTARGFPSSRDFNPGRWLGNNY